MFRGHDARKMEVTGGKTTISFYPGVLQANGLHVDWNSSTEGDKTRSEPSYGFQIDFSNLRYSLDQGRVGRFDGGTVSHKGGFRLISGKNSLEADHFIISPSTTTADGLELVVDAKNEAFTAFDLVHASAFYEFKEKQLIVGNLDVVVTLRCAQELGRPDLAGRTIGYLKIYGNSDPIDGGGSVDPPSNSGVSPRTAGIDLALFDMGGISWLGRTGTYPNGNNALTLYTTSCNVGTVNVPWNAPMSVTHPGIIMNLYRINNGRFEQIGWSWVKHGFYATNASQCGSCSTPGGSFLGPACSDTYGGGNNDDQYYLGGRDEWNPQTGMWTCQNSWFSNYVNDCTRRNTGTGLTVTDHRLTALDSDLGISGAQYYYEARYINANDRNIYNNIASRHCTMSWTGSQWSFSTVDSAEVQGPAINRWGDMRSFAQPQTDGDVIVAVQTTSLGNGMYHYEYAVYNSSLDRQIQTFSIPMPNGMTVQNIGFRDIDQDGTNNWPGVYANNSITWSTTAYGSSNANPLKYSSVFNFRFDANLPPVPGSAQLGLFKPGGSGPNTIGASSKAPPLLQPVDTYATQNGNVISGNQQSLANWDGDRLVIKGGPGPVGIVVTATSPTTSPSALILGVVSSCLKSTSTSQGVQTIGLYNWLTKAWEKVDFRNLGTTDTLALVTITSNAARFVNSSTRQVKAIVTTGKANNDATYLSVPNFNQVGFQFNN